MNARTLLACLSALLLSSEGGASVISGPVVNPANNHTYFLLSNQTWTASEAEAVTLGGHLATVNDAAENEWLMAMFGSFGGIERALWIGLSDAGVEGVFFWSSGEPLTYVNWGPGLPDNYFGDSPAEDYVQIMPLNDGFARFKQWNDAADIANPFFITHGVAEVLPASVPEPGILSLVGIALLGLSASSTSCLASVRGMTGLTFIPGCRV